MVIKITRTEKPKEIPKDDLALGFGKVFSDHMFLMDYESLSWSNPRIIPYGPISMDPASMCLHYGQEIFEGLKAYHGKDDGIYLFRPRKNIERMNRSAKRLMMPELDPDMVIDALKELVLLDKDWIPTTEGCSLYIRPTMIAMDPFLGVRPSNTYLFFIITGPVAAYYAEGFNPVSIYTADKYVRAVRGGVGDAKTAGNYAASLAAQMDAKKQGYSQVLWLDAIERRYVEEVGTMNIMFKIAGEVITAPLKGSILPGITRDSVITLLKSWNVPVSERPLSIDEIMEASDKGTLEEVFGTGTAAIISPVKEIAYKDKKIQVGDGKTGPLAQKIYDTLLAIQYGKGEDPYGWCMRIDK
ncbi:MAG: branched-chain amino acid aminotransferase [Deltaproteobacteria bacterium]|nr:branched-chain amino acid aminotransferase [Deltaproteobacteria bacterium]